MKSTQGMAAYSWVEDARAAVLNTTTLLEVKWNLVMALT